MRTPLHALPATRPRALGYVRVSRARDDMISPELQETAIRDHCARNGYDLIEVLDPDLDVSGRLWKRRKIEDAITRVETGDANVIVVWKISRVSRNRLDWSIAVDRVESVGGRLESATEPFDTTTSAGRFGRGVMADLAVLQSEQIGEMWHETHQRRWRNGLPHSGRPRFGYQYNRATGYTQDPDTAPIIRQMYERYLAGDTYHAVMLWLQPMRLGTMRTHKSVSDFMDSGFAAGWIIHHNPECPLPHRDGNRGCKNRIRTEGAHEPIISREQFDAYETARRARAFVPPRLKAPLTAYAGLVYCTACGWRYVHHRRKDGGAQYRCGNTRHCPKLRTIARSRLDTAVLKWLPEVAGQVNSEARATAITALGNTSQKIERERLERVAIDADKALIHLAKDFARRLIPEAAFIAARDELTAERDTASSRAAQIATVRETSAQQTRLAADLLDAWPDMLDPERNRLLKELAVIHVTPIKGSPQIRIFKRWEAPELERIPQRDPSK